MVLPSWRSELRTTAADKETTCQPRLVGVTRMHTRRRSAYKVQQLTGYGLDVMDDYVPDSDSCSDSSSLYSDDGYGYGHGTGYNLVPLIETDGGDVLGSTGSSWVWALPASAPPPPCATGVLSGHVGAPGSRRALGEALVKLWDPAFGQFTDSKAAGEYHRIATELAARPSSSGGGEAGATAQIPTSEETVAECRPGQAGGTPTATAAQYIASHQRRRRPDAASGGN